MPRTALVISGGGSKGAFAVGAIDFMATELGIEFDIVAGTSTGALIAPILAHGGSGAVPRLKDLYTSVQTSDIITRRDPPEVILKSPSVYDARPLRRLIERELSQEVAAALFASTRTLVVTAVGLQSGELHLFHAGAPFLNSSPKQVALTNREDLVAAVFASACMPVFMQPVQLPGASEQFVDGGVREYAPVEAAILAGADIIYCLLLSDDPAAREPLEQTFTRVFDIAQRSITLLMEEVGENDVRLAALQAAAATYINAIRERMADARYGLDEAAIAAIMRPGESPIPSPRPIDIKIIRPKRPLAGGTLSFDPVVMQQNMAYGYECARDALAALVT